MKQPESNYYNSKKFKAYATDKKTGFVQAFQFCHTNHSSQRAAQRGINQFKISTALLYGETFQKQGLIFYVLGENKIPDDLIKSKNILKNTIIVLSGDSDEIITCYRSKNPFKHINKKTKFLQPLKFAA